MNKTQSFYVTKAQQAIDQIFTNCPTIVLQHVMNNIKICEINKGDICIKEGDICNGIFIVLNGSLKLFLKTENKTQVFLFKTVDDIIGLQFVMNNAAYNYNSYAMEDSLLAFIHVSELEKMSAMHPQAYFSLMKKVNQQTSIIETRLHLLMTAKAEKIVLKTMLDLKTKFGVDNDGYIDMRLSIKELASYLFMSKTNLYRVLQTLKEKNILTYQFQRYKLEKC